MRKMRLPFIDSDLLRGLNVLASFFFHTFLIFSIITKMLEQYNITSCLFYSGPRFGPPYSSPKAAIQSMLRTRGNSGYGMSGSNQHSLQTLQMMQQHQKSQMVRAQIRHQVGHNRMSDIPPGVFQRQMQGPGMHSINQQPGRIYYLLRYSIRFLFPLWPYAF
jgi:hypothetical protein